MKKPKESECQSKRGRKHTWSESRHKLGSSRSRKDHTTSPFQMFAPLNSALSRDLYPQQHRLKQKLKLQGWGHCAPNFQANCAGLWRLNAETSGQLHTMVPVRNPSSKWFLKGNHFCSPTAFLTHHLLHRKVNDSLERQARITGE